MRSVILATAVFASGAAFATEATFNNHLTSSPMVSPAQLYQVDALKTDFSLGFSSSEATSKPDGGDELSSTGSGTAIFAGGIYNVKDLGLRAGLTVNYMSVAFEDESMVVAGTETSKVKSKSDANATVLTPQVAMPVGPVVIGAALDVTQTTWKPEEGDSAKSTVNTFRPGVLFADKGIEAGLTYSSPNRKDAEEADELPVYDPAIVTAHGRYALGNGMAVGGILTNTNWKAIDEDLYKDQMNLTGTFEMDAGQMKVEGDLAFNGAYYKDKDVGLSESTISTIAFGGAADYGVNANTNVGGGLNYEFGSDKNDAVEINTNTFTLALRGNMRF